MKHLRFVITLSLFSAGSSSLLLATPSNAATDFSITNGNPNGVWTYGFEGTLGGALTPFATGYTCCSNAIEAWADSPGSVATDFYNPTGGPLLIFSQGIVGPGQAGLWPGVTNETFAVFRFIAAITDTYTINGGFSGLDTTTTDVHIALNSQCPAGVCLFNNTVSAFGPGPAFSVSLALTAGDTLDFIVGNGGNGDAHDATGLAATISGTPEPATWALTGLGLLGALIARRRFRNHSL